MADAEALRLLIGRVRSIASDCFDLGACERLRILADEMDAVVRQTPPKLRPLA
jgi:hypothetical protein